MALKDTADVRKSSLPRVCFNYMKAIIEAGIIGMPYALRECGIVLGLLIWVIVAAMTDYSMVILARSGDATGAESSRCNTENS